MEKETLEITALAYGGKAVGRRSNGKVCFLPGALPGEKVLLSITEEQKNYSLGTLLEVLTPAKERIESPCPYGNCPSCPYNCMEYSLEWEWKKKQFASFLAKLKNIQPQEVKEGIPAPERLHYRNKIKLALEKDASGRVLAGYRGEDNRTLIPIEKCLLAEKAILQSMEEKPWGAPSFRKEKSITFRHTLKDGVKLLREGEKPFPLTESLGELGSFLTGSHSFFQINRVMAEKLAKEFLAILARISPSQMVELYCGCGVFSSLAAEKFSLSTVGIELDKSNTALAKENALLHNAAGKCRFICGDAATELEKLQKGKLPPGTLLLVDPPRTGLDQKGIRMIRKTGADFLCYISCGAPTLMRDLTALQDLYCWNETRVLDLFPGTAHFESISLLSRI